MGNYSVNEGEDRRRELLMMTLFTIYHIGAFNSTFIYDVLSTLPIIVVIGLISSWIVFFLKKGTEKTRELIYVAMVECSVVLYGWNVENITLLTSIFVATVVIAGLLGAGDLLYIADAALLALIAGRIYLYHTIIISEKLSAYYNLLYLANLFVIEFVIHFWVNRRDVEAKQRDEIIQHLRQAEQSKDDFMANVSHEIRTPINTICGLSEVALQEADLRINRECLHAIQTAGRNLTMVVGDILDFSELQSGKMELENEAYNIASTIHDVINMMYAQKGDKPIDFTVDCDADLPCVLYGDEKKLRRVIMNLINNAIKFTEEGGIHIAISGRRESYGLNLSVSVKDTGIGMTEENLEKLFSTYNQVDATRTRHEGGIGLGLALSQIIVQKMGGIITIKSKYNEGTTVKFVVPQEIVDTNPIVSLQKKNEVRAAVYINFEQIALREIRDEYLNIITHMRQQLQIESFLCRDLAALKRKIQQEHITHVFITMVEYGEAPAYFDELAKIIKLVMILDREDMATELQPEIIRLSKPLYVLPVVAALNENSRESNNDNIYTKKFIAPEAHVLVVDDNWMNLKVIEGLLAKYQIHITMAVSGEEALEKIETKEYDFVFMDHMMPEMDGVECLHHIRNKIGTYYSKIPIIAVTANAIAGSREFFINEGFADFIEKPIEMSVLDRLLRRHIPASKMIYLDEPKEVEPEELVPGFVRMDRTEEHEEAEAILGHKIAPKQNDAPETKTAPKSDAASKPEMILEPEEAEKPADTKGIRITRLDEKKGILYSGSEEAYHAILEMHCENGVWHIEKMNQLLAEENWKNYTIEAHALKGMMLGIGADSVAEAAKALEFAGKEGRTAYILENHEMVMEGYRKVIQIIKDMLGIVDEEPVEEAEDLVILNEEQLNSYLESLENAVFDMEEASMLDILAELDACAYGTEPLKPIVEKARSKVEMSDYMSALDTLVKWKEAGHEN